ncbi:MAG: right-handed parallel beta-helix repeat-containing protein [Bacteroidia bacterium]|nr:right-handed parallel beta-helix repeat-containing protein [Bacteroidia bacterium]
MKLNSYIIHAWLVLGLIFWIGAGQSLFAQISLPYDEGFESAGPTVTFDTAVASINGVPQWEFQKTLNGRLRFEAGAGYYRSGSKAATLDQDPSTTTDGINYLIGTLDLSNYGGSSDIEFSFWFMDHGEETDVNDRVWVRGDTGQAWIEIYNLHAANPPSGVYTLVSGLDLDSILLANSQTFSTTTQIRFGQEDNFPSTSTTVSDGFTFDDLRITGSLPIPDNAGLASIDGPTSPSVPGMNPVDVTLFNFGTNNITTVTLNWEVNGVAQTAFNYSGTLAPTSGTPVTVGMFNFPTGFNDIKVWTSMPNGMVDMDNGNDTLETTVLFCNPLVGTYTVGGAAPDYATLADAIFALNSCGVSGAVTMDIRPGTYNEMVEIGRIPGVSAANTVTFDGGSLSTTLITDSTVGTPVVFMNGADYITFKNVTIENRAITDSWGVQLTDTANFNTFDSVRFQMPQGPTFDIVGLFLSDNQTSGTSTAGTANNANYMTVQNCIFTGGSQGVSMFGTSTATNFTVGNKIMNSVFEGQTADAIYVWGQDSMDIMGNTINAAPTTTFYDGMDLSDIRNYRINGNLINSPDRGIEIDDANDVTTPTQNSEIINNMVNAPVDDGFDFDDIENTNIYHNTVRGTPGMFMNDYPDVDIKNNIFASPTGKAIDLSDVVTSTSGAVLENNIYFTNGPDMADDGFTTYGDLLSWLTASPTINDGSLEGDPNFVDPNTDLHCTGILPFGAGNPALGVGVDIDGDVRPLPPQLGVEIGADEYDIKANDAGVVGVDAPSSPFSTGMQAFEFEVANFGLLNVDTVEVSFELNGVLQPSVTYTIAIPVGSSANNVAAGTVMVPPGTSTIKAWTSMPNNVADEDNSNDTLFTTICTSLDGNYTIGGAGADYADFASAAADLTGCGISGNVVFNITPGTYTESFVLDTIPGSSATSTVTFNGGSQAGTIISDSVQPEAIILMQRADWVTFTNLTIENRATTDSWGVRMTSNADHNTFDSVKFQMAVVVNAFDVAGIIMSSSNTFSTGTGVNANFTTIDHCTFEGGFRGVSMAGLTNNFNVGNRIMNSVFSQQDDDAVFASNQDSLEIMNNNITHGLGTFYDGLDIFDATNIKINGNYILSNDRGINLDDINDLTTPTQNSEVINNMVIAPVDDGFDFDDVENLNIWHNTVLGTPGMLINDYPDVDIRNNIFSSPSALAVDFTDATTSTTSANLVLDYNVYFTGGTNIVEDGFNNFFTDVASWVVAVPGFNANSNNNDPIFFDPASDLHLRGGAANDMGDNTVGVLVDIDGETRPIAPSTTVDIGADEYTPLQDNATPASILTPSSTFLCGDSMQEISVVISNLGTATITNLPIDVEVTGDITASLGTIYAGPLPGFESDTVVLGTINTSAGGTYDLQVTTSLTGDQELTNDTLVATGYLALPLVPTGLVDTVFSCDDSVDVVVNAFPGANYGWYDSLNGGMLVGEGDTFRIPSIATQNTYYVGYTSLLDSITSLAAFSGGNGQAGNMFDLTALANSIVIDSLDIHIGGTGTETVEVYYTDQPGGYAANAGNAAAWTLAGSATVTGAGIGQPTRVTGFTPITVPQGSTYGIYVTLTTSTNIDYTNGSVGDFNDNGTIRLDYGFGLSYPFGGTFSVRIWNGRIYYSGPACSEDRSGVTGELFPDPEAGFSLSSNLLTITINDTSSANTDSVSYDYGDGNTGTDEMHTYVKPGTYTVCQIAYGECTNDTACAEIMVSCPAAVAGFAIIEDTSSLIFVNSVATGAIDSVTYTWGDGTSTTVDSTGDASHFYLTTGEYEVCQIAHSVCGNDTTCMMTDLLIRTGLEIPGVSEVAVYPNPNRGSFYLNMNLTELKDVKVEITDIRGKVVFFKEYGQTIGKFQDAIKLEDAASGMYFMNLRFNGQNMTRKVRVE